MQTQIKKYLLLLLIIDLFLGYTNLAFAQTQVYDYSVGGTNPVSSQIKLYLCAPTETTAKSAIPQNVGANLLPTGVGGTSGSQLSYNSGANNVASSDLYTCINKLYKFAIAMAAVIGVFYIVLAGYLYISSDGNQESVDKAKSMITSTVAALVILFVGFLLLKALNPDLIQFRSIQPPSVKLDSIGSGLAAGTGGPGGTLGATGATPSGSAQDLAKQILNNTKISLASGHPSGNSDNANAKQNITDISNGQPAQRSSYTDSNLGFAGPGGSVNLNSSMLQGMLTIAGQYSFRVSEIAGGVHANPATKPNDPHYAGNAFDVDQINGAAVNSSNPSYKSFEQACTAAGASQVLGPGDTGHSTHIHCGWAPGDSDAPDSSSPRGSSQTSGILSFIPPWPSSQDPYPNGDWSNTNPALQPAFQAFSSAWQQQGGSTLSFVQIYRPPDYTKHLRSVWEIYRISKNLSFTEGYGCDNYNHVDSAAVQAALKTASSGDLASLQTEYNAHGVTGPTPPACNSDHSLGIAIDVTPPATSGSTYQKFMQVGQNVGLCHYIAGDTPHFALTSTLPAGTNCQTP